jgi:hypothetical protein
MREAASFIRSMALHDGLPYLIGRRDEMIDTGYPVGFRALAQA